MILNEFLINNILKTKNPIATQIILSTLKNYATKIVILKIQKTIFIQ